MSTLNKVILIGNLGDTPEVRELSNGNKVANISMATSEEWKDKTTGEKKTKANWHRVVIFGRLADVAEKYCNKGSKIYVCGKLQTRKWTDQSGQDKYTTEVVVQGYQGELIMLDTKDSSNISMSTEDRLRNKITEPDDNIPF
tara:strand:- start:104 stop:529 length:426 start_codon:yes stop_codon:yes gene_type:complete